MAENFTSSSKSLTNKSVEFSDHIRACYESATYGPLSVSHPLQARIYAQSIISQYSRDADILNILRTQCQSVPPSNTATFDAESGEVISDEISAQSQEQELQLQRANRIADIVLQNMMKIQINNPSSRVRQGITPTIAFAQDLQLLLENYYVPSTPVENKPTSSSASMQYYSKPNLIDDIIQSENVVPQKRVNTAISQQQQPQNEVRVDQSNNGFQYSKKSRPDDGDSPQKKNPFVSAKEKFIQEGFKLPQQKAGNNSNTSTQQQQQRSGGDKKEKNEDSGLIDKIENDIIEKGSPVSFDDIAGLEFAKKCVQELIVWPMSRPDLFKGLRAVPKGILLFGPPGTGKTLIGKAIAHSCNATFFNISASSLTSKWIGEGEKAVRILFVIAAQRQPSVVFIDEVDSLLSMRTSDENDSTRRIKTEFLVQLDGAGTDASARIVVIGATNRPDELDEGARRRFVKRLYIPLPDEAGRTQQIHRLLRGIPHSLNDADINTLVDKTAGFSGADMKSMCTEAAMGPVRATIRLGQSIEHISEHSIPPISVCDFYDALESVTTSVSTSDLDRYVEWNALFGSYRKME